MCAMAHKETHRHAETSMTIGSLFSGTGGLELGLEWAGLGPVLWQVEKDPFCRRVLEKHWPDAERFEDVETITGTDLAPVDVICGGFPCQDISPAGTGKGLAGERSGLWREFARIVAAARPRWVVIENVGGAGSRWVDAVAGDLEQLGYETLPCPITAWGVGAPHIRSRIFLLAYAGPGAHQEGQPALSEHAEVAGTPRVRPDPSKERLDARPLRQGGGVAGDGGARAPDGRAFTWGFEPDLVRAVHGIPPVLDGGIDAAEKTLACAARGSTCCSATALLREMRSNGELTPSSPGLREARRHPDPVPRLSRCSACGAAQGKAEEELRRLWTTISPESQQEAQNVLTRMFERAWEKERAQTMGHRVDRVAALGNAVVPQCAEVIGWVIRELAHQAP